MEHHLTDRELATVLVALRELQQQIDGHRHARVNLVARYPHFTDHAPLTSRQIDGLCERLNTQTGGVEDSDLGPGPDRILVARSSARPELDWCVRERAKGATVPWGHNLYVLNHIRVRVGSPARMCRYYPFRRSNPCGSLLVPCVIVPQSDDPATFEVPDLGHYPYMSAEHPGKIAYTESPAHGIADRQTVVRPGRYLERYYPWVPLHIRNAWIDACAAWKTEPFKIVTSADDIERIYRAGPESCMSHAPTHYSSSQHPVRVYGNSDLSLAYLERDGRPVARALVWVDKKIHGRIYGNGGNENVLRSLLSNNGYTRGSFDGARIRAIEDSGTYLMPYIDGHGISRGPDWQWWILSENGYDHEAGQTNGLLEEADDDDLTICGNCEEPFHGDETYCPACRENRWACVNCDYESFDDDDRIDTEYGGPYCAECVPSRQSCEVCNTEYWADEYQRSHYRNQYPNDDHRTRVCPGCRSSAAYCDECDRWATAEDPCCCSHRNELTIDLPLEVPDHA